MSDKYGGLVIPAPVLPVPTPNRPEMVEGDLLVTYFSDFLQKVMTFYAGAAWSSVHPAQPIVKKVSGNSPESGFNENWLPCLFVYRPGRETREVLDTFVQVADDYRFQKGRLEVQWILNPVQQTNQRVRDGMLDAVRKVIDRAVQMGRDPAWTLVDDPDTKAEQWGSSLLGFTGCAVIELDHAAPGTWTQTMELPAKPKNYDVLKMSFAIEELLDRDITINTDPNEELSLEIESPDQNTGLGPFDLGDGTYT